MFLAANRLSILENKKMECPSAHVRTANNIKSHVNISLLYFSTDWSGSGNNFQSRTCRVLTSQLTEILWICTLILQPTMMITGDGHRWYFWRRKSQLWHQWQWTSLEGKFWGVWYKNGTNILCPVQLRCLKSVLCHQILTQCMTLFYVNGEWGTHQSLVLVVIRYSDFCIHRNLRFHLKQQVRRFV